MVLYITEQCLQIKMCQTEDTEAEVEKKRRAFIIEN